MSDHKDSDFCCNPKKGFGSGSSIDFVLFTAFLGALVYFLQHATGFWDGVLGFFKACVWPAIVVYKLLEFLL